jgi:hypothetical protein
MGMRLRMTRVGQPRMVMRCSTCQQEIGGPIRDAAVNADATLLGAVNFAVCPCCRQIVPEHLQTPAYKAACTAR